MNSINFIYRKKRPGAFSIEELFQSIEKEINKQGVKTTSLQLPHSGAGIRNLIENITFVKKKRSKIYHITGEVQYAALGSGKNTILTVHDVGSAIHGSPIKKFLIKLLWFWIPSLIVKKITTISEFSKKELTALIPWAKNKINVIHNPVNDLIIQNMDYQVNSPTPENGVFNILHIGTKSNKNLLRTIEALNDLPCVLTIVGTLSPEQEEKLNKGNIVYENCSNISFEEIIQLYKKTDLVCFASTYEGFGMPIIEAQALGKPVITSNISSMPEIAGTSAVLVNPYATESIRNAILSLINDESFRLKKIEAGYQNVKRFLPETICAQYIEIYKSL